MASQIGVQNNDCEYTWIRIKTKKNNMEWI